MSKTKQILAELTEDHPVFKAAMAAYDGVKTIRNSFLYSIETQNLNGEVLKGKLYNKNYTN